MDVSRINEIVEFALEKNESQFSVKTSDHQRELQRMLEKLFIMNRSVWVVNSAVYCFVRRAKNNTRNCFKCKEKKGFTV